MAIKVQKAAVGNAPNTGAPGKTPAPTVEVNSGSRGVVQTPGQNGPNNPSSIGPGKISRSQLGQNLFESVDDPAIASVIGKGTARNVDVNDDTGRSWNEPSAAGGFNAGNGRIGDGLLRDLATGNSHISHNKSAPSPVHPSMAGPAKGPAIPSGLTNNEADPVRKPS